jgi:hypothetical protein
MTIPNLVCAPIIPDSLLAKEATEILRKYSTDLFSVARETGAGEENRTLVRRLGSSSPLTPWTCGHGPDHFCRPN